jgi:hypothetical protein
VDSSKVKNNFSKTATIHSNDLSNPTIKIELKGIVKKWVIVEPGERVVFDGFEGEELKRVLTLKTRENVPFKIEKIDSNLGEKIKTNLKTVKENAVYELEIIKPANINENIFGTLTVYTNIEKRKLITLEVRGTVRSEVRVTPTVINFGNIDTTKTELSENLFRKIVILEKIKGEGLSIKGIKFTSEIFKSQTEALLEGKRYRITITLDRQNIKKGKLEEEMAIDTNYERNPVYKVKLIGNIL